MLHETCMRGCQILNEVQSTDQNAVIETLSE